MNSKRRFIAEFESQSFIQLIFPHEMSDWAPILDEAENCFSEIITAIAKTQQCLVIAHDYDDVKNRFEHLSNVIVVSYTNDDTWSRDCSALTVEENGDATLLDFTFNAWGGKFESCKDNAMTQSIKHCYNAPVQKIDLVLEGGSVETNGQGLLLTTTACLLNPNRNPQLNQQEIERRLKSELGVESFLWLKNGELFGDDTDAHIDTLARFVDPHTIMYVKCTNTKDEHFNSLSQMEYELIEFSKIYNLTLIPLPLPSPVYFEKERLPATYANFLITNSSILLPVYGLPEDAEAIKIFKKTFKNKEVLPINCTTLIKQHGSLHCVTMQFPVHIMLTLTQKQS